MDPATAEPYAHLLASDRAQRAAARLGQMKRWHPEQDVTELEQNVLAARLDVAVLRLLAQYPGVTLRPEQADATRALLTGAEQ